MKQNNGSYRIFIIPVVIAIISGIAIQAVGGLIWGGKIISRLEQFDKEQTDQNRNVERIDARTQQLPIIDQRLKSSEDLVHLSTARLDVMSQQILTVNPLTQLQIDTLKQSLIGIEERQQRVIESLDNIYNVINSVQQQKSQGLPLPTKPYRQR